VRWLFPGNVIQVNTRCLDCGEAIRVTMQDEAILEIDPPTAVGYMMSPFTKWREGTKAFN